ncbi:MAG: hypothetical protein IKS72_04035, partial [Prevotella sp.]|nr:hypothetical protein [Prevotella sp.]
NGNSIFLPASGGYRSGGSLNYVGSGGGYWSSSLLGGIPADAYCLYFLYFDSGNVDRGNDDRSCGQCVRPVINKRNIASEYVDLGLPSGVKWATCNVGATSPEEYGEYFAWGETTKKDTYSWETYVLCDGSYNTLTKYCNASKYGKDGFTDELTTLQSADDAATANWGEGWRTPTQAEFEELVANTKSKWTTLNGVNGYEFTAENGNSIFLPAVSHIDNTTLNNSGESGIYWTASLWSLPQHADNPSIAFFMDFNSSEVATTFGTNRCFGMNIRPVFGENQTPTGIEYNSRETLNNSHYYSIDGKRLSGEPTKKGVYIVNGRKVVK